MLSITPIKSKRLDEIERTIKFTFNASIVWEIAQMAKLGFVCG